VASVLEKNNLPGAISAMVCGDADVGWELFPKNRPYSAYFFNFIVHSAEMAQNENIKLLSFTGSTAVSRSEQKTQKTENIESKKSHLYL